MHTAYRRLLSCLSLARAAAIGSSLRQRDATHRTRVVLTHEAFVDPPLHSLLKAVSASLASCGEKLARVIEAERGIGGNLRASRTRLPRWQ